MEKNVLRVAFANLAIAWKVGERTGTPCPFETSGAPALADLEDEHVSCSAGFMYACT